MGNAETRFRRYYTNRFPLAAEVQQEPEEPAGQGNVPQMMIGNPWIAPMVRKYRFMRLSRSEPVLDTY
uniref:Bacteriophage protein n=1 Tax=Syphacia muris TaxID=451379 RepID=A0A0N5AJX4_9BILA